MMSKTTTEKTIKVQKKVCDICRKEITSTDINNISLTIGDFHNGCASDAIEMSGMIGDGES